MQLFVPRDDDVPLRDVILGFDLNVVQNYYDWSALFCAFPNALFTKQMRRLAGRHNVGLEAHFKVPCTGVCFSSQPCEPPHGPPSARW